MTVAQTRAMRAKFEHDVRYKKRTPSASKDMMEARKRREERERNKAMRQGRSYGFSKK